MIAYLCLGSNIGERALNLQKAVEHIQYFSTLVKTSSILETLPQYELNQPNFLNQALEIETNLSPHDLLKEIKAVEVHLGRQLTYRNGPRVIDIDILFYDQEIIETPGLTIPHPLISERAFVLEPLCEIAPKFVCPKSGRKMEDLLSLFTADRA